MTSGLERWLPVVDFVGSYEVSDQARVRSVDRTITDRIGQVRRLRGSMCATHPHPNSGHIQVVLWKHNIPHTKRVHRLMLEAFVGLCPPGMEALHWNDIPDDNRLDNLRWGTSSENSFDLVRNGNHFQASKNLCPRDHLLRRPNLVACIAADGRRACLACSRASTKIKNDLIRHGIIRPASYIKELSDTYYTEIMRVA